jgi:autoinducer 2-degrading protein
VLIITVTFVIHDAHRKAFLEAALENASTSLREEQGCLKFDVCKDSYGSIVFLYEQYVDDAAFSLHLKSPHFLSFNEASAPWVKDKRVDRYQLVSDPLESP